MLSKRDLDQIREITREVSREVSREVTKEVLREELPAAFDVFEIRMDRKMDARFAAQDGVIEARFQEQDRKMDGRFAAQDRWITARFDRLEGEIDGLAQATAAGFTSLDARVFRIETRLDECDVPAADEEGEGDGPWLPPFRPAPER